MSDSTTTIDGLPPASTPLTGTEEVPIWQGGATVKVPVSAIGGGSGTVTAVSVSSANGFAGSSSGGTTPALTLSTTISGLLKGNGTAISAAVSGTDIKTVNGTSLLGSGNVDVGVTSITASTTPVNGLSLSGGVITGIGTIQITGTLSGIGISNLSGITGTPSSTTFLRGDGTWGTPAGGGSISGSGTTNYIAKFTGTAAIGNSLIFDNGTSVGINTSTPDATYKLDVAGDIRAGTVGMGAISTNTSWNAYPTPLKVTIPDYTNYWGMIVQNTTYGGNSGLEIAVNDSGSAFLNIYDNAGTAYSPVQLTSAGHIALAVQAGRGVGIGAVGTSSFKLDVAGTTRLGAAGTDTITLRGQVSANSSVGTSGQLLTSQGANLPPQWASLNLSSPPAIGGTTPNTITGTTITGTTITGTTVTATSQLITTNVAIPGNSGWGVIECVDDGVGDGYNNLSIYSYDGSAPYAPWFPGGIAASNFVIRSQDWETNYQYVWLQVPAGMSSVYTLTLPVSLPTTTKFLQGDASGNLSWASAGGTGTVTSVSATSPLTVTGTATVNPTINIPAATTSVSGYLTSSDWNAFSGKQAQLVSGTNIKTVNGNSLLGSGNLTVSATPAGSSQQIQYNTSGAFAAASNFIFDGNLIGIGTTTISNGLSSYYGIQLAQASMVSTGVAYSLNSNLYTDAGAAIRYITGPTTPAGRITVNSAQMTFETAPGGAAGSVATLTTAMSVTSTGINGTQIGYTTPSIGIFTILTTNTLSSSTAPTNTVPALALTGTPNSSTSAKTGVLGIGPNFTASDKNILASFVQNINDYTQIVTQNISSGTTASADFIVNNDNTTGLGTYADFGINSSGFTGTGSFSAANAAYLYSQGGDLVIGTQSANILRFVIGSSTAADAGTVTSTGLNAMPIGATTASTGKFTSVETTGTIGAGIAPAAGASLLIKAGSTSVAPIQFTGTSAALLTTPVAGSAEYDGALAYFTPSGTARALLPSRYYYRKNTSTTINNATGNQSVLGLTNGVTLAASTIYEVDGEFQFVSTGTTSHTEAFGFVLTTATLSNMGISVDRWISTNTAATGRMALFLTAVAPTVITAAITTAQTATYRVRGTIAVSTGGQCNPVIALSAAPGATSTITAGAWFQFTPIGTAGSNVSIGTWS